MHNRSTAYQPRSNLRRVFLLLGILIVLAVLAGGYFVFWRHVARQLEAGVEAWATEQRALGNEIAFAWDGIGGFPFRFAATFREPSIRWHDPRGEVAWTGAALRAEMAPWNLSRIAVSSAGQNDVALRLADSASGWRIAATSFAGTVDLYSGGQLRGFAAVLQQPDLTPPDGKVLSSAAATVMLELPPAPPADFNAPLARVVLDAKSLALPPGTRVLTAEPVQSVNVDATIKGPMPLASLKDALAAWRDGGGVVELQNFGFAQGPLALSGNATLALDPDLQPEGAGTITTAGLGAAVEILIADGLIPPDRAMVARATAKALEKPGADGRPQATVGLSLQNRTVSFGPVPLFALQPIAWP